MTDKKTENITGYFAAANSERGFVSWFDGIFRGEDIEHIYIIKGGPGTGKSRFMEDMISFGREKGYIAERFYCSSDPTSLDGVILERDGRRISLLDGTPPHAAEPQLVGVREDIINLGMFWDREKLVSAGKEIKRLSEEKALAYKHAYRALSAAGQMRRAEGELCKRAVDMPKLFRFVSREVSKQLKAEGGIKRYTPLSAISMRGEVRLDSFRRRAETVVTVEDICGTAHILLGMLAEHLGGEAAPDPLLTDKLDALLTDGGTLYTVGRPLSDDRVIRMRRFVDAEVLRPYMGELRRLDGMSSGLKAEALRTLDEAAKYHFALEEIYARAMDFSAKERYTEKIASEILA